MNRKPSGLHLTNVQARGIETITVNTLEFLCSFFGSRFFSVSRHVGGSVLASLLKRKCSFLIDFMSANDDQVCETTKNF